MGKWPRNDLNANTFFLHVTNQQQWINTMTAIKAAPTYSSTSLLLLFDLFVWQILRFFHRAFLFFAIKKWRENTQHISLFRKSAQKKMPPLRKIRATIAQISFHMETNLLTEMTWMIITIRAVIITSITFAWPFNKCKKYRMRATIGHRRQEHFHFLSALIFETSCIKFHWRFVQMP